MVFAATGHFSVDLLANITLVLPRFGARMLETDQWRSQMGGGANASETCGECFFLQLIYVVMVF